MLKPPSGCTDHAAAGPVGLLVANTPPKSSEPTHKVDVGHDIPSTTTPFVSVPSTLFQSVGRVPVGFVDQYVSGPGNAGSSLPPAHRVVVGHDRAEIMRPTSMTFACQAPAAVGVVDV